MRSIFASGSVKQKDSQNDKEDVCFIFLQVFNIYSGRKKREIYVPKRESGRRGKKA